MTLSIIDILILIVLLISGVVGWKRGVFKELVLFVGSILVLYIGYKLKNVIGDYLVLYFPFFDFPAFLKGALALNIVLYQTLAFLLVSIVLLLVYEFLISLTGILEKLLRATIILGIPSKILGFIVGLVEGYVFVFVFLFFLSLPVFNLSFINNSEYVTKIVKDTPVLSSFTSDITDLAEKIYDLKDIEDSNEVNLQIIDICLDSKVTSVDVIDKLIETGKLNVNDSESVLNKYRND